VPMGGGSPAAAAHSLIHDDHSKPGLGPHSRGLRTSVTSHYDKGKAQAN
jgi:hypothetical protein